MVSVQKVVTQALSGKYIGIAYSELDCQALVEKILSDCGESHNWRGSNDMWRNALSEKHKITNEMDIPAGAWLFTVKNDGGEKERGYNDAEGNAAHVGLYLGFSRVIHSTTGGVQWDDISRARWTHWGLCKYIDYSTPYATEATVADYYRTRNQYNRGENNVEEPAVSDSAASFSVIDVDALTEAFRKWVLSFVSTMP